MTEICILSLWCWIWRSLSGTTKLLIKSNPEFYWCCEYPCPRWKSAIWEWLELYGILQATWQKIYIGNIKCVHVCALNFIKDQKEKPESVLSSYKYNVFRVEKKQAGGSLCIAAAQLESPNWTLYFRFIVFWTGA